MAYRNFKDLNRRTAAGKVLRDKAFNISKNPKFDGYQRRLEYISLSTCSSHYFINLMQNLLPYHTYPYCFWFTITFI